MATIRPATQADEPFLREMSALTAAWRPGAPIPTAEELAANPHSGRYIDGWIRDGDAGVVAEESDGPVGAAWYRRFTLQEPGYGFLDEDTPEISLAVDRDHRHRGIGTALLDALCERASRDGLAAISLSVERDNPALRIYQRAGFVEVAGTIDACTMRRDFRTVGDG